jgi:hypothetical protein
MAARNRNNFSRAPICPESRLAEPFYAFVDNLVRSATGATSVAAVLSLPKSQIEMTVFEQGWQDRITKVVGRVAKDLIAMMRRKSGGRSPTLFEDLGSGRETHQWGATGSQ